MALSVFNDCTFWLVFVVSVYCIHWLVALVSYVLDGNIKYAEEVVSTPVLLTTASFAAAILMTATFVDYLGSKQSKSL